MSYSSWESSFPDMANYRAKKAGIALAIQKKTEARYDEEDGLGTPHRVMTWMNETLEDAHNPCPGSQWRHFLWHLRDGSALCKLINKLRVAHGMSAIKFANHALTPFQAMENIECFNKAAMSYGLPETSCFQSVDLYEGHKGPFLNVINCLNKLGFLANSRGFPVRYEAIEAPKRDAEAWAST